jgi:hypothetical protein
MEFQYFFLRISFFFLIILTNPKQIKISTIINYLYLNFKYFKEFFFPGLET